MNREDVVKKTMYNVEVVQDEIEAAAERVAMDQSGKCLQIENTMLLSFDTKFIRRDQKQRRNGEACRGCLTCFRSNLINLITKDICGFLFIIHY